MNTINTCFLSEGDTANDMAKTINYVCELSQDEQESIWGKGKKVCFR